MTIVCVAVNVRVYALFDYIVPSEIDTAVSLIGRRVRVPLGTRQTVGIVMECKKYSAVPITKLKKILETYDDMPPLPTATLNLIRFCAEYYHCPVGIAAAAAVPTFFRRPSVCRLPMGYRLTEKIIALPPHRKKALHVCEWLQDNGCQTAAAIGAATDAGTSLLSRLVKEGFLERGIHWPLPPLGTADTPPTLTSAQARVLAAAQVNGWNTPQLLFGDTGSGKTEVYMQLAAKALDAGGQILILAPEIHLTPQMEENFRSRFPTCRLCILHSGLADGERAHRWLMALSGQADIVLGTRLAVFTPLPRLKLIVVDEEHDESYKQDEGLPFSARDLAVWRAKHEKAALVCGSATPSLESYENTRSGRYQLLRLDARVHKADIHVALTPEEGTLFHGMSQPFLVALGEALNTGGQALIFINRRGYAPTLVCGQCRWTAFCESCETNMTLHRREGRLLCHRCGAARQMPLRCEGCGNRLTAAGSGTQRIEEALTRRFALPVLRLDSDSLSRRDSFAQQREAIAKGKAPLLVGTQIVAKGHNFPHLSFIGILNADSGLSSADFRAEERLLMLLRQVIGRGTRNPAGCRVLIQTCQTEHPFYKDLLADNLESCWKRLLTERKRAQLPPYAHIAVLRASATTEKHVCNFLDNAVIAARAITSSPVIVYDPVPAPVAKAAGRWRWQLATQSVSRPALHQFLSAWIENLPAAGAVRWHLDIDPAAI